MSFPTVFISGWHPRFGGGKKIVPRPFLNDPEKLLIICRAED